MLLESVNTIEVETPTVISNFPFDIIKFAGNESIDFLQRITTNDFSKFANGSIQKTLLVTDKGRTLDAVWVIHRQEHLLMLTSKEMAQEIIPWFNKYIIMEDIVLNDVSKEYRINLHFSLNTTFLKTDYFGIPVSIEIKNEPKIYNEFSSQDFTLFKIHNGIPTAKKEIVQDYNPLELNLWDWISFTKGCYIGQEVIARLDTYNKIQRVLCKVSSDQRLNEQEIVTDEFGNDVGKITSVQQSNNLFFGLAVIRNKFAIPHQQLKLKENNSLVRIDTVFKKDGYGRN